MLDRRIRIAGVKCIEAALSKLAFAGISAPTLSSLKAQKTKQLNTGPTATAAVPKVLSTPTS